MNKKILWSVLIIALVGVGVYFMFKSLPKEDEVVDVVPKSKEPVELCFGLFTPVNERGFSDKYTLRMLLDNEKGKVAGELNFLPGEKDSKVGKYEGTVTAVDRTSMSRTIDAVWDTFGEGINAKEEIKIIFGEGTASIGAGELVDKGDGVYRYKDPKNLQYGLNLSDIACNDLVVRKNIEEYLKKNISTLSPVKAVLGGSWYVIGVSTDLAKKSGIVVYEDGHIQEKREFNYEISELGEVNNLKIK